MLSPDAHAAALATPPRCARCGAPIGVYEPLVYEDADGVRVTSALLRLPPELRAAPRGVVFFHHACADAARSLSPPPSG